MSARRIVVTGMGAVTPLGSSVASFWDGLISGRSGIRNIKHFDAAMFDVRFGGDCPDFPGVEIDHRLAKRMDRFTQFAYIGARQAFADSGLQPGVFDSTRASVILGTGIGGITELEEQHKRLLEKGPSRVSAFTIPKLMANACSGHISIALDFQGCSTAVATACASAANAMADAITAIRTNLADIVLTGGTEAALTPLGLAAFAAMHALSTRNDDPQRASRPFDRDRDGFVLSEGAGVLMFEEYEHAKRRNAQILAEVIGVGATADAGDMVQPDPEGAGAARAMRLALADAKLNAADIDYINAHATSTPIGDVAETCAIKSVFGPSAKSVAISSTKGATGHLLGASGGIEAIASILAIRNNTLPPTLNLEHPDEKCDLDYVPRVARDKRTRIAMSNSFGFGGHNVAMIFRAI